MTADRTAQPTPWIAACLLGPLALPLLFLMPDLHRKNGTLA
jgi:hypothetical protein